MKTKTKRRPTEADVLDHLRKHGRFLRENLYGVRWGTKLYLASDTRALVVAICRDEGIPVFEDRRRKRAVPA